MGVVDFFRGLTGNLPERTYGSAELVEASWAIETIMGFDSNDIWRTQPAVRTVVGFTARNVAQLGLHSFLRDGDERERTRTDLVARVLSQPNPDQTGLEMIYALVADWALNDDGYLMLMPDSKMPSGWLLRQVPSAWVKAKKATPWAIEEYWVTVPGRRSQAVPAEYVIHFHGWNPVDTRSGVSNLVALKDTMAEQISAARYRKQVWDSGARVGSVITRPSGTWSPEAKTRFIDDLKSAFARRGSRAGGPIVLEDGMTMQRIGFSAHEEQFVEAAKLALATVAQVYFINPTMIGMLDNANYANVREFRRALYGDSLGWPIAMLQERLNAFLVPRLTTNDVFVEFNVEAKLRGSFEEQAKVVSTATGAPWQTRNEARRMFNMPPIDGGDELITPLNVLVGGQASPQDGEPDASGLSAGEQRMLMLLAMANGGGGAKALPPRAAKRVKAGATTADHDDFADVLARFFKRQRDVVKTALGAKADGEWWDEERWNSELAADLYSLALSLAAKIGRGALASVDLDPSEYDPEQTLHYLEALAANTAGRINTITKRELDAALEEGAEVAHVFEVAIESRAPQSGAAVATGIAGFAAVDALKQLGRGDVATKSWAVTSTNPRPSHAAMNGETVSLDENFSNGAKWPGDIALDVDEIAGCTCAVEINLP